ncbi:unnamed protein product [Didymodactylos carnosus]|uniref:Serpin domain-containing protein n=1 Tax=Didymodactylos carnosus TaxID=1234261 RepID=A0A815G707_9BILA|nr:unnamed protein product [Didymodactylos carnosus]CAF1422959.1 unnamed protein product [Didymodactylos carnosus]CAF4191881.1 unnamed protein product [Didymodactylos carnosus]CAF4223163.1 unnamed protein product [Didymodactylos carnosus]
MPRVKIASKIDLKHHLKESGGMQDAFDDAKADFSGITEKDSADEDLVIENIVQSAIVVIDEDGVEAAAASLLLPRAKGFIHRIEFKCDRPFFFFVHDQQSHTILHVGKYNEPS